MHPLKGKWACQNKRFKYSVFFEIFFVSMPGAYKEPIEILLIADNLCTYLYLFSWKNGLLFHQAVVDLSRSAILLPLGNKSTVRYKTLQLTLHFQVNQFMLASQ